MKSIRRRLLLWFLLGLGVLWLVAGVGVYYSYRAGLLAGVETELQSLLRQVRMSQMRGPGPGMGPGGGPHHTNKPVSADFGPDIYWQVWPEEGGEPSLSENLSEDLPRLNPEHGQSLIQTLSLSDGHRVMLASSRFGMGSRGVEISVAKSLASVQHKLRGVLLGLAITGLAAAAAAILWVLFAVRDGLAPLRRIADRVGDINVHSLSDRIGVSDTPSELEPIVTRLNQLMTRLETSFTRERRFSADLAHEMRTPVAELRMLAETAKRWPDEGGSDAWNAVLGSIDRMETVVQAMLRLARLEQASNDMDFESISLSPLVSGIWAEHAAQASARGLILDLDIEQETTVVGDPALWRLLLGNLLANAVAYADEGSAVRVFTEETPTQGCPTVCVSNAAASVGPDTIDKLFDRFWRGESARTESSHCGLGLPLALACGEAMNLRVWARLQPEEGGLEVRIEPIDG